MTPLDLIIALILLMGGWYSASHIAARWFNARAARSCQCEVVRSIGNPASLFLDLNCGGVKLELLINRLPWDNPINLAASVVAGRRPYALVRFKTSRDLGVFDASRSGGGRRVGNYYLVNTSGPREVVDKVLELADSLGAWRITASNHLVQLLFPYVDCRRVVEASLKFYNSLSL